MGNSRNNRHMHLTGEIIRSCKMVAFSKLALKTHKKTPNEGVIGYISGGIKLIME